MNVLGLRWVAIAWMGLAVVMSGCDSPKAAVDVDEQLKTLVKGDVDAKIMALAVISTLGHEISSSGPKESEKVVKAIRQVLKDQDPTVRRTAVLTLGTIGPAAKAAVPELKELLKTADREERMAVVTALQAIDPSVVPEVEPSNGPN